MTAMSTARAAVAALCLAATPLVAQEAETAPPEPERIEYGDWAVECRVTEATGDDVAAPPEICEMRTLVVRGNPDNPEGRGTILLQMGMGPINSEGLYWTVFHIPLGVLLGKGVRLYADDTGDEAEPLLTARIVYCDPGKCVARTTITPEQMVELDRAEVVQVRYIGGTGQDLKLPLSLSGYMEARDRVTPAVPGAPDAPDEGETAPAE